MGEQLVEFDFRLPTVITDFAGTPSIDIQTTIRLRGPVAFRESFFVYKGLTDSSGNVTLNRFELRSASGSVIQGSPNTVQKDTWYRVSLLYDWNNFLLNGLITAGGGTFWDPPSQTLLGGSDGNLNQINLGADASPVVNFYFDNFTTAIVPEPSMALLLGLGGWLLWRRPRR